MPQIKNRKPLSYSNQRWKDFAEVIKRRDQYQCLKCGRSEKDSVLQVHHTIYKAGKELWEYPTSELITLCSLCHADHHKVIEPAFGWKLIEINDLEDDDGICERQGCGKAIRYEHLVFHPEIGYKIVGSHCVEILTRDDRYLSERVITILKQISHFVNNSDFEYGITKNGKYFEEYTYKHSKIRIFENIYGYAFNIAVKEIGKKWYHFGDFIKCNTQDKNRVLELAYIVLRGTLSTTEEEKQILRNIYQNIKPC